ncbi:hypothetical protein GV64_05785 [Endozoicomonas elysicola]|uniref:Uncharacterized protein n=2 Tax=Endozoicomonas elysicola TaxID=305900 RepID=A0A081K833_9GAMM|nr:hypothetical protein GV64_05785 [Endozoicomonas elysicola]
MYLGIKVTEFETSRYLKVFLAVPPDPENKNISGLDVMICSADVENLFEYEKLEPKKNYEFKTKIQSGAQNKISIRVVGIKQVPAKQAQ